MAITLQTVLPQKVLPRAPSPNASSPNPGIRSAITQFIPASPDASLDQGSAAFTTAENDSALLAGNSGSGRVDLTRALSSSSRGWNDTSGAVASLKSPVLGSMEGRKSMSAGAGSRRGIAHSIRILGVDKDKEEAFALSQLTDGKVDVSFEGNLTRRTSEVSSQGSKGNGKGKGKSKARDGDDDGNHGECGHTPLFDVDLESGQPTASSSSPLSRAGRLLQIGSHTMPWKKSKSNAIPAYQAAADDTANEPILGELRQDSLDFARPSKTSIDHKADYSAEVDAEEDGLGAFDDDRQQLLYGGADDAGRPGYFAPGDRSFGYNSLGGGAGMGGYGDAVGFEAMTWREGGWMVLSSISVAVLMLVAILISIDVIDWPGDGIGKD